MDVERVEAELSKNNLMIIAGTIFDDLVSESNFKNLQKQLDDICSLITKLPCAAREKGRNFPAPYLVIIDWGHNEREYDAGHPERALRLPNKDWDKMMVHIRSLADRAWENYRVRSVIHPHAGGYIEFEDEINRLLHDIPYETAGLVWIQGIYIFQKWIRLNGCKNVQKGWTIFILKTLT